MDAKTNKSSGVSHDVRGGVRGASVRRLLCRAEWVRLGLLGDSLGMRTRGLRSLGGWSAAAISAAVLLSNPVAALAGPEGEHVSRGSVTFVRNGGETIITASNNSVINYRSFDIASNEVVRFVQPDATSRVLNRINSAAPTRIDGGLFANGRVYIVNPSGVIFGRNAVVDVAGLHAAAGRMSDADFLRGTDRFTNMSGQVINQGSISGDFVALLGKSVFNAGSINAPEGTVVMAAGDSVLIGPRDGGLMVRVEGSAIVGEGGAAVKNDGTINTTGSTGGTRGGRVMMAAGDVWGVALGTGSSSKITSRDVKIEGQGRGVVEVRGTIDATNSGAQANASENSPINQGKGGDVRVLGEYVALEGAKIDASGATGGGRVLVGGNYLGTGAERNATATYISSDTNIKANATEQGNGGRVIVWADNHTGYYGKIEAKGAGTGGGGFVETSGKETLDVLGGRVDARSGAQGTKNGTWLLDPRDVTITNNETNGGFAPSGGFDRFTPTGNNAQVDVADIVASLNGGTNVEIITGNTGTQDGNITVSTAITKTAGGTATLLMRAANNINVNANISSTTGALNVDLRAGDATNGNDATSVVGQGNVAFNGSATVTTNGGFFSSTGNDFTIADGGNNAVVSGAGAITINHTGAVDLNRDLISGAGNISVTGQSFLMDNGATIVSADGSIAISAADGVDIQRPVTAGTTLTVTSGTDGGNDDIVFNSTQATLAGSTITLRAGNGGTTSQINFTNLSAIRGADATGNPTAFNIVQDAAVSSLPGAAIFNGGSVSGVNYGVQSGSTILIDDVAAVSGANLTLNGATSVTLDEATDDPFTVGSLTINGTDLAVGGAFTGGSVSIADQVTATGAFTSNGTTFQNTAALSATGFTLEHSGNVDIDANLTATGAGGFLANRTSQTAGTFNSSGFTINANNGNVAIVAPSQTVTLGQIVNGAAVNVGGDGITTNGTIGAGSVDLQSTAGVTINQGILLVGAGFVSSGTTFDSAAAGDITANAANAIIDINHTGTANIAGDLTANGAVTVDAGATTVDGATSSSASSVAFNVNGAGIFNGTVGSATNTTIIANDGLAINNNVDAGNSAGNTVRLTASADGGNDDLSFGSDGVLLSGNAIFLQAGNGSGATAVVDLSTLGAGATASFLSGSGGSTRPETLTIVQDANMSSSNIPAGAEFGAATTGMTINLQSSGGSIQLDDATSVNGVNLVLNGATGVTLDEGTNATFNVGSLTINGTNPLTSLPFNGAGVVIADSVNATGAFSSSGTTFQNTATISATSVTLEHSGNIDVDANITATGAGGFLSDRTAETAGVFNSAGFTIDAGTGPVTIIAPSQGVTVGALTNAGAITLTGSSITQSGNVTSATSYDANGGAVTINGSVTVSGAFTSDGTTFQNTGALDAASVTLEHSGNIDIDAGVTTGAGGFSSDRTAEASGVFDSDGVTINAGTGNVTVVAVAQNVVMGTISNAATILLSGAAVSQNGSATGRSYTLNATDDATINGNITANDTGTPANSLVAITAGSDGTGDVVAGAVEIRGQGISFRAGDGAGGTDTATVQIGSVTLADRTGAANPNAVTIRQDASIAATDIPLLTAFTGGSVTGMNYTLQSDAGSVDIGANAARVAGSRLTLSALNTGQTVAWTSDLNVESLTVNGAVPNLTNNVTATNGDIVLNLQNALTTLGGNVTLSAVSTGNGSGLIDINSGAANAIELGSNLLAMRGTEIDLDGLGANSITGGGASLVRFETSTAAQAINVGTLGSPQVNALDLTAADLQTIDSTVGQVTIGRVDGAHADIRIGATTLTTNTLFRTPSGGLISVVGALENTTSTAFIAFVGNTFLSNGGSIATDAGQVDFQSPIFLNSTLFTIDTSGTGTGSVRIRQGGNLAFLGAGNTLRLTTGAVTLDLADGVTGNNSNLDLLPEVTNGSISVGSGVGAADLAVGASVFTGLADGFGNLNLGTSGGSHAVELGSFAIRDPLAINLGAGGSVLISGTISGAASTVGNPGSLTITSPTITLGSAGGGAIDLLTGSVTINGAITVDDAATRSIATDSGNIDLNGEVDSSSDGTATLTLDSGTGDIILRDVVGGNARFLTFSILNARDVNPVSSIAGTPSAINAINLNQSAGTGISRFGAIDAGTTGAINDRITLTGTQFAFLGPITTNTGLNSGNMILTSTGAVNIAAPITLNGSFDHNGAGTVSLGASIDTSAANENITFDGPVVITQANTLTAGTGSIIFNNTLNLSTFITEMVADGIDFLGGANSVTGSSTATLILRPSGNGVSIGVGGGAGTLDISDTDLLAIASGAMDSLLIGNGTTGNHAITIGTAGDGALFRNAVSFRSPNGTVTVDGTITGENNATNVGISSTNPIVLNAGITTTGGFIALSSDVTLGAGLSNFSNVAVLDTTNAGADTDGANVTITGGVNAAANLAQGIDINAGDTGAVELGANVGSITPLLRFAVINADTVNATNPAINIAADTIRQDAGAGAARYATLTAGAGGINLNANSFTLSGDLSSGGAIDVAVASGQLITLANGNRVFTTSTPGASISLDGVDGNTNNLTLNSAGNVTIRGDISDMGEFSSSGADFTLDSTGSISVDDSILLVHNGDVTLNAGLRANASGGVTNISAGTDDTGNVLFGEGVTIASDIIVLAAGNGAGGTNLSFVDADGSTLTTRPTFFNSANDNRPVDFRIQQDLAITDADLPDATQFGGALGGATPMIYRLVTLDTLTIDTPSKVDGANLILTAGNGITINSALAPSQIRFNNAVALNGSINTSGNGDIIFDNGATAGGDLTLDAGDNEVVFNNGAFDIGANDVVFSARDVQINAGATVTGSGGTLALRPDSDGVNILIGGVSDTIGFDITADELGRLTASGEDRFSLLTIGRATGTATIFIDGASTFFDPFQLLMNGSGGSIRLDNALAGREDATVTLSTQTLRMSSSITSQGRDISIGAASGIIVDADNVAIDATNAGGSPAGADVTVNASIDSDDGAQAAPGNRDFAINAGTGGMVFVEGAIGATDELSTVTISAGDSGGIDIDLLDVRTSGAQTYNAGRVGVNDDLTSLVAGAITINGNLILQAGTDANTTITTAGSAATDDVVITGVIDTQIGAGERELIIDVGTGDILVGGNIGFSSLTPDLITDVDFTANTIAIAGVRTSQTQTYNADTLISVDGDSFGTVIEFNGPTRIDRDLTVTGSTSVSFNGAVTSQAGEGNDLTVNAPLSTFAGNVGGDSGQNFELGAFTTDAGGTTVFGQTNPTITIRTLGAQTFGDAVNLSADATFTSVNAGIAFGSTLNSAGGARNVVVNSGGSGITRFASTVGNSGVLASLTTNGDGTVQFNGNVTTSGDQTYNDAAIIETNTVFTGAGFTFAAGIDSASAPNDLTIAGTNAVTIGADSGTGVGLRNVSVTGATINTRSVRSSNTQVYNGATTLNGTLASISSGAISVNGSLTLGGNSALTTSGGSGSDILVTGAIAGGGFDFDADAGAAGLVTLQSAATNMGAFSATGATIATNNVTSSGAVVFDGAYVLDNDVTINSGGNVSFNGTVDTRANGTLRNLTVNTSNNGQTLFAANVGASRELANLTTNADGTTRFNGTVVNTNSDQVYNDAVLVAANTVFSGNDVAFGSSLNPTTTGLDLNVRTADAGADAGEVTFGGDVGVATAFRTITTQLRSGITAAESPNAATILGGTMHATGDINFFQSVVIAAPTTIASSGGTVNFYRRAANGSVINAASGASDSSLTILSGATPSTTVTPIRFNGSVGTTANRLTSVTLGFSDSSFNATTRSIPNVPSIVFSDSFNDAGEVVATTVAATDAFTIATGTGGFAMARNEKLMAFGGVAINTTGAAAVGDISAISSIRIDATGITLLGRSSGSVLEPQAGVLQNQSDFGLDFVADQSINFNAPTTLDGGSNASFAVSDAAATANTNAILIDGSSAFTFLRGTFRNGVNVDFFKIPIGATNLTPLDLRSGGTNTSVATALAGAIPRDQETRQVTTPVTVSRALQEVLVPMGISLRDLTDEQIVTFLVGRSLYNDVPQRVAAQTAADFKVTPNRLSNAGALRAIAAYRALATTEQVGEDGAVTYVPRTAEVQTTLEESWYRYLDECDKTGETPTGTGWRRWLENPAAEGKAEEDAKALESLNLCREYFQRLEELNLSPREVRIPRDRIIAEIKPGLDELTVDEFLGAITGNPMARAVPVSPAQPETAEVVGG